MALQITDASFEEVVLKSDKPVLVDFWATWCGPCRMLGPVIEELATEYEGKVVVGKVDVDNNQEFAKAMNDGILGLSLPEEIGFNYNKRRVEYDNSILEQLQKVNKPLPEGAKIKDYHTETYNGKSIKEIQKEQYGKALERAAKLKSYFSPDLGGTWDAATVNNN